MVRTFPKINSTSQEVSRVVDAIRTEKIKCRNHVNVMGDDRFWGVDESESKIIVAFRRLAKDAYKNQLGKSPAHVIIMANHISSTKSIEGSGGGWHVDSVRDQYKLFMYLTDCTDIESGPLTLLSSNNFLRDKWIVFKNYLIGNKFRFKESFVERLIISGFTVQPILKSKLVPFFVNTSLIHRGGKITKGDRVLLTAYMFERIPASIQKRLENV